MPPYFQDFPSFTVSLIRSSSELNSSTAVMRQWARQLLHCVSQKPLQCSDGSIPSLLLWNLKHFSSKSNYTWWLTFRSDLKILLSSQHSLKIGRKKKVTKTGREKSTPSVGLNVVCQAVTWRKQVETVQSKKHLLVHLTTYFSIKHNFHNTIINLMPLPPPSFPTNLKKRVKVIMKTSWGNCWSWKAEVKKKDLKKQAST